MKPVLGKPGAFNLKIVFFHDIKKETALNMMPFPGFSTS
jgi:hypothetical protein